MQAERIVENLNRAHHELFGRDPAVCLIGEDLLDPYGGAFKVSRDLSTRFPERVLSAPISECAFTGMACGMALAGEKPIVEIMFGDFIGYAFDPLWNLAAKSVSMYGRRVPIHLLVRCTVGGNRGFGATHSQSPQKHFLGIPDLDLFEVNPFHDNVELLAELIERGNPVLLFENKTLYSRHCVREGALDDLFSWRFIGPRREFAKICIEESESPDAVIVASGSVVFSALEAARRAFLDHELETVILTPAQLHPLPLAPILDDLARAKRILVIEEGIAGGSWAESVATAIYSRLWGRLENPVICLHSKSSIIPCARHLEERVLLQSDHVFEALIGESVRA